VVHEYATTSSVLVAFDQDLTALGLVTSALGSTENILWVALSDLKFVCRY
jgi:hypothetical protein